MAPGQEHMFDEEPLPTAVVLDSDFVINVLHENEEFHAECMEFAYRLIDASVIVVYSNLLRVDFWHGWRSAVNAKGLPPEVASRPCLSLIPQQSGSAGIDTVMITSRVFSACLTAMRSG